MGLKLFSIGLNFLEKPHLSKAAKGINTKINSKKLSLPILTIICALKVIYSIMSDLMSSQGF